MWILATVWGWRKVIVHQRICGWKKSFVFLWVVFLLRYLNVQSSLSMWIGWHCFFATTLSYYLFKILLCRSMDINIRDVDVFFGLILIQRRKCCSFLSLLYFFYMLNILKVLMTLFSWQFVNKEILRVLLSLVESILRKRLLNNSFLSLV